MEHDRTDNASRPAALEGTGAGANTLSGLEPRFSGVADVPVNAVGAAWSFETNVRTPVWYEIVNEASAPVDPGQLGYAWKCSPAEIAAAGPDVLNVERIPEMADVMAAIRLTRSSSI